MALVSTLLTDPNENVGRLFTVPLTATVLVTPPVVVRSTVPEGVPVADEAKRTYTVVLLTLPPLCVKVTLLPKPEPAAVDTSKPDGAVATIFAVRLEPETLKFCVDEAVPAQVLRAAGVPLVVIVGTMPDCHLKASSAK